MNYTLHFLPEVEDDLFTGYLWYEEKAAGPGEEFIRMFYARMLVVTLDEDTADVNCDGGIDIVDALLIAQYYVGLLPEFCTE